MKFDKKFQRDWNYLVSLYSYISNIDDMSIIMESEVQVAGTSAIGSERPLASKIVSRISSTNWWKCWPIFNFKHFGQH